MNILVCIKQVPDTTQVKIDPVTNTLIREGVPAIVNPFDMYALEAAARIRDSHPEAKIVVMSMGPENAKRALRECLSVAADRAYLISGRPFGGSDTLATSYILSRAIEKVEQLEGKFDMIFCGKQAIDGDTAQVGPELAEHLGLPQVTCALEVEAADGASMDVLKEDQDANLLLRVSLPCVCTFTKPKYDPRDPTIRGIQAANRAEIPTITDLDFTDEQMDKSRIGLKGSPTNVKKSFVPVRMRGGTIIREGSARADAEQLVGLLRQAQVI